MWGKYEGKVCAGEKVRDLLSNFLLCVVSHIIEYKHKHKHTIHLTEIF